MNTLTPTELVEVLKLHSDWLANPFKGRRADLHCADLSGVSRADLYYSDLRCANLSYANLSHAILTGVNLDHANLSYANLYNTNLHHANLSGADLRGANLPCASLTGAKLSGADLRNANLSGTTLFNADLTGADLTGADLRNASLSYANLVGAKLPDFQLCPQTGTFEAYKKVFGDVVLKLRIEGPRTSSLVGRKCRTSKAFVVEAYGSEAKEFKSLYDPNFIYKIGEYVEANYNSDIRVECTSGIHFFMTRQEAEAYDF